MGSVLQTVFSLSDFQTRYTSSTKDHAASCPEALPADCVECQMLKVADGLLSGRYSHPANFLSSPPSSSQHTQTDATGPQTPASEPATQIPVFQAGIKPTAFKALVGKGHAEFSTMRQQDAEEFLTHLITLLRRDLRKNKDRVGSGSGAILYLCQC